MAVTSFEIASRSLVLDGRPFGPVGAYEKIAGVLRCAVDPKHSANETLADLALAPRNSAGLVEYAADFYDVTTGNNADFVAGYPATTGWDPVTGLGTPNAANLIPDLVAAAH